ncbi:hypothetical protein [Dictyoglomus sp.]|uniref:hypothetical protein n=2 Tax=Dictyoglomus TaxID=13 RepID=UPI003D119AAE
MDLKSAVERLISAQEKTEERIEELVQAQRRTEERLEALTEAQRKSEERIARLETAVEALTEAQRKTEEEIRELTLAMKNMQKQINGIAKELGELSHSIDFQLEDRTYRSLPYLLKRDFGIEVKERLIRKFIKNKKGEPMEINILGKGERDGKEIFIVGEAKANLSLRHIIDFIDRLKDIREVIEGEIFPIIVTYMTEPETEEFAKSKGITIYYSYDFEYIY